MCIVLPDHTAYTFANSLAASKIAEKMTDTLQNATIPQFD
jgi:hypothetical protein